MSAVENGQPSPNGLNKHGLSYVTGGLRDIQLGSIWSLIQEGLGKKPSAAAVISTHQTADHASSLVGKTSIHTDSCLIWSIEDMYHGASRIAAALEARGVQRGSTLMTLLPNSGEWCLMYWVSAMLQLTLVPLDSALLTPGREDQLLYFLDMLKPSSVIVAGNEQSAAFDQIAAKVTGSITTKLISQNVSPQDSSWTNLHALVTNVQPQSQIYQDESIDQHGTRNALILFTSGTSTGRPKGCPITVNNLNHAMRGRSAYYHMFPSSRVLLYTVNFRAIHVICNLAAWHGAGGVILAGETFNPKVSLQAMEDHKATWAMCVPAHLQALAAAPNVKDIDSTSLEFMALAGDVITDSMIKLSQQLFPHSETRNVLGMTEGVGCVGWEPGSQPDSPTVNFIASVGKVLPGSSVKITDKAGRTLMLRGEIGEVHLGGETMIQGYFAGEQKEVFYKDETGYPWIITGDQGVIDKEGFFYVLGRSKDVIKRNAVPLSPSMIEVFLQNKTGLQSQAFSIPSPHPGVGEEAFIVVQTTTKSNLDLETIPEIVVAGLGQEYRPYAVARLQDIGLEEWPKNETGKVVKGKLREGALKWLEGRGQ